MAITTKHTRKEKQSLLSELLELILEVIFYAATAAGAILPFCLKSSHTNSGLLNVFGSVGLDLSVRPRHGQGRIVHVELSYWPLLFLGPLVFLILALLSKRFRSSKRPFECLIFYLLMLTAILVFCIIIPFLFNVAINFIFRFWIPVVLISVLVAALLLFVGHKKK